MPNPYTGTIGYNTAIDDAVRCVAAAIDAKSKGDVVALEFGVKIISAITALRRKPRHRRTKAARLCRPTQRRPAMTIGAVAGAYDNATGHTMCIAVTDPRRVPCSRTIASALRAWRDAGCPDNYVEIFDWPPLY